jgi:hypothetical protein
MNIINIPEYNRKLMEATKKEEIIKIIAEYENRRPHNKKQPAA